ncbi:hypothetical protein HK101_002213 [Irineochytrium annulatum]|nr:hypothetical protein HK101_002213 [Irineochytrium annulatum]
MKPDGQYGDGIRDPLSISTSADHPSASGPSSSSYDSLDSSSSAHPLVHQTIKRTQTEFASRAPSTVSPFANESSKAAVRARTVPSGQGGIAKKARVRAPLYVSIVLLVFLMTALMGSVVGWLTISKSQSTIDDITTQMRLSILNRATQLVNNTLAQCQKILQAKSTNYRLFNFVNDPNRTPWMSDLEIISYHYDIAAPFTYLENSGVFFQADANGNQSYMAAYPRGRQVYFQDATTNYNLTAAAVLGTNADATLKLNQTYTSVRNDWAPNIKWPALKTNGVVPGQHFWVSPIFTPIFKTFLIPLMWPVWPNSSLGTVTSGNYYATHFVMTSIKALDDLLQTIEVTPNGVVALIDGKTGRMLSSSLPGISQNGTQPSQFPAIGNPNPLVSASASYLATAYNSIDGSIEGIPLQSNGSTQLATTFLSPGGDTVLVNAVWIIDAPSDLKWLFLLAIPSSDFLAVIRATLQQAIAIICASCALSLPLAFLLSYAVTSPLRKLSAAMREATQFDFSSLRNGYLDQRSSVSEIGSLQGAFNELMIKFASGIQANKALALVTRQATTTRDRRMSAMSEEA